VSTNVESAALRVRRASFARRGVIVVLILTGYQLTGHQAWAQAPQTTQAPPTQQKQQTAQVQQTLQAQQNDLTQVSIENLMDMEVTSVSKKDQKLSEVASAIFVVTQEDIRRSGATNIPDLLRMVPGMNVAQINANTWAIAGRGLNGEFANELLVMVDGRAVYTPTTGGVFWDVLDIPLEDIERIEVIRGPGGSVWGANAVNGVINILTKKASETKGAMLVAGGGNLDQGFGTAQYGGSVGKNFDYRVYTKYLNQDHLPSLTGQDGGDGWHMLRGGFRADGMLSSKDSLTIQGDMYTGNENNPTTTLPSITSPGLIDTEIPVALSGGFIQSIWNHTFSARSESTLMMSYANYERDDQLREGRETVNIDFQHHISWGSRQDFVWGLGYWYSDSHSHGDLFVSLNPSSLVSDSFNSFVQDEITLIPNRFFLTVGTKLEHNYYTGFALMPSARASYELDPHNMMWAAVSKAERTPDATDASIRLDIAGFPGPGGTPVLISILGNPQIKNEGLIAYEFGYRTTVAKRLSFDLAAYYNDYSNQESTEPSTPFFEATPVPAHLVLPSTYENLIYGETHGVEIAANWKITDRWTLSPGFDFERIHMHASPLSQDTQTAPETNGSDPHVQAQVRSHFELSPRWTWDASAYFVDRLIAQNVPSYTRLDTGLSWRWKEGVSLSLVGQNLLSDHHLEFIDSTAASRSTEIKRSAYVKLSWRF
jgi:iron complex outermembrane receptor protein